MSLLTDQRPGDNWLTPQSPDSVQDPRPVPKLTPSSPELMSKAAALWPRPASLPSLGEPAGAHPQEPNGPNCQALGCHGDRGNQGQGGAPQTQPAPPQQGGCSLFVLCSMLGGGQLRRRGRFHISMEIWGPLGPGGGAAGRGGVGKPPSSGQAEVLPHVPKMGVRQVGGQDGGAPASPLLPGISVRCCPPGMSRGPGDPESWGAGVRPASEGRWELAPHAAQTPEGAPRLLGRHAKGLVDRPRASAPFLGADGGTKGPQQDESQPQALRARPWGFLERKSTRWILKSLSPRRPSWKGVVGWMEDGSPRGPTGGRG